MIQRVSPEAIQRAATLIKQGEVVAYPTETCYGLAVDVSQPQALQRLAMIKGRTRPQPVLVLLENQTMLDHLVTVVPAAARELMEQHWPGALTLILPGKQDLPAEIRGEKGGVGVRISSDPVAAQLVAAVGKPISSTSANVHGAPPAQQAQDADLPGVALVLDDGPRQDPPSTLVEVIDQPRVLRQGPVDVSLTTIDTLGHGAVLLEQPSDAYRFNIDAVLLADFAHRSLVALSKNPRTIVDLGAGCGVIGLLLARNWSDADVHLVEIQERFAAICQRNIDRNQQSGRMRVHRADFRAWARTAMLPQPTLWVTNPPFFAVDRGHLSPNKEIALAKHELECCIDDVLATAAIAIERDGTFAFIHDANRRSEIESGIANRGLHVVFHRSVMPLPDRPAHRVLYCLAEKSTGATRELDSLIVHQSPGLYSAEVATILELKRSA